MDTRQDSALIRNGVQFTDDIPIGMKKHGWTPEEYEEIFSKYYFGGPTYVLVPPERGEKENFKTKVSRFFARIFKKRENGYEVLKTVKYDYMIRGF